MTLFSPQQTAVAALLVLRLTGLIWVAPVFSGRPVPRLLKVGLLGVLTVLLLPMALAHAPDGVTVGPATILAELTVGLVLGLGAAIFVAAAESSGDMIAVQMGLSGANVLDPLSQTQMPILGQFLGLFVLAALLSVGGHVLILQALARSLEVAPVASGIRMAEGGAAFVLLGGELFLMGLRFAAPVVAAMMIGNAALGVMARTVPQLNVLMVAFPLQIAIGLFVLAASLPLIAQFFMGWPGRYDRVVGGLLRSLAPAGGL